MDASLYVGRNVQQQILRSFLTQAFSQQSATATTPRLFLLHGDDGMGKTALIDIATACAEEIRVGGKSAVSLVLDLDAWRFRNGMVPSTPQALIEALYAIAAAASDQFAQALATYESLAARRISAEARKEQLIALEWPQQMFLADSPAVHGKEAKDFAEWLSQKMDPVDLALCNDPESTLTEALCASLVKASQVQPLAIVIDSLDIIEPSSGGAWLRSSFLPRLLAGKSQLAVIIGCSDALARQYRNTFADDDLLPVALSSIPLTVKDIATIAHNRSVTLTPDQAAQIEQTTAGMPLATRIAIDVIAKNGSLANLFSKKSADVSDAKRLVADCFERHVSTLDNETDRMRILSTVLLYRLDENILSQHWDTTPEETTTILTDLALRYSFMQARRPHEAIYPHLKALVIKEAARGRESSLFETFSKFSDVSARIHEQYLAHMIAEKPDGASRYADPNFQITLIGSLRSGLWIKNTDTVKILPGLFIETLHYNPDFAPQLLSFADDCAALLSEESARVIETLKGGLSVVQTLALPIGSAKRGALKALDFMKPFEDGLNELQQGLLSRMRGILACQAGNYDKAMDAFLTSASLFATRPIEYLQLFGNFLTVGCAQTAAGDMKKAAAAFEKAVAINPNDFFANHRLALTYQALKQHQDAIAAFEKTVAIDAAAVPAWIELGNEYATVGNHEKAVEAFIRATELDAQRPIAWFKLGLSLEALKQYAHAEKALSKTVEILPEHWEAFFALGRVQSAQGLSHEAISSLNNVVELNNGCTEAWKWLGKELYGVQSFERAATALEKAVELDPNDAAMWELLAKSWFGANNFEKAVDAAEKAVALKDDLFDAWVTLGQSQTELSNFKEAHASFAKAAELNPNDGEIWVNVGNSLYAQGKYNDAIEAFQKAVALHPDVDSIWHNIGLAYQVQQHHAKAIEAFAKAIEINPASADSWYQQGRSYAELSQYAQAAASFSKTVELSPDAHDAWYRKGLCLSKTGSHAEAITTLIKASELNPTDADIWNQMGLSYVATGKAEDAVKAFAQAIALAPNRPEVHFQHGLALESLSRFEEATAAYRKAVELSPEKVEAWQHLGLCYNFLGRHGDALPPLHKALELSPDNEDVLLPIALAAHAIGDFDQAVTFYKKVIAKKPDSEEAMYNLALALHAMGNYAEAIPAYHAVVKKWPGKDQAWYNMGLAYHAAGDFNQAVASYREAARLNPDFPDVWYHMGLVFYATEHYGEAIQAFRKVISRAPDMYEAWFNIGNAYLVWHEYADAIEAYEKAVLLKPDDYSSWGYLGSAYFGAGRYEKAVEACGKAFALNSEEPWIINSLALSRLFTGDATGALPLFQALLAADTGGQEVSRAIQEIEKALARNPALAGAQEALRILSGEAPAEETPQDQEAQQ